MVPPGASEAETGAAIIRSPVLGVRASDERGDRRRPGELRGRLRRPLRAPLALPPSGNVVVVNLGDAPAAGHVSLPWDDLPGRNWRLADGNSGESYERSGDDLRNGMYVGLDPWGWHLFDLQPLEG